MTITVNVVTNNFTAVCRSIDQNPSHSTQERCLLVALVQTVYTTYGNDGIHFGVGTAMAAPAAAGSIGYLVVAAGAAATAAPTAAGTAMTAVLVAAGAMAMATAPTAAGAAQRRQQGHQ